MATGSFEDNVFINCPFDDLYQPMFRAIVFSVLACGFVPRCALEVSDAGEARIDKICKIIAACKFGLHDVSRVELDPVSSLPRFNMPFELGLFLGCKRYGVRMQKSKICIVLDSEQYRYQKFISDIAGQDISAHGNDVSNLIRRVRDWLAPQHVGLPPLLGASAIADRYKQFAVDLPAICASLLLDAAALTFTDLVFVIKEAAR